MLLGPKKYEHALVHVENLSNLQVTLGTVSNMNELQRTVENLRNLQSTVANMYELRLYHVGNTSSRKNYGVKQLWSQLALGQVTIQGLDVDAVQ